MSLLSVLDDEYIPYILLSADPDATYASKLASKIYSLGAIPTWTTPVFRFLGVDIPVSADDDIKEQLEELEHVYAVKRERIGDEQPSALENTTRATVEPVFEFDDKELARKSIKGFEQVLGDTLSVDAHQATKNRDTNGVAAIIDSGIDQRNPNINNVIERENFTSEHEFDVVGHGTLMALILQHATPNATFYDMKVAEKDRLREASVIGALAESIAYGADVVSTKSITDGVDIVNMSLGFPHIDHDGFCPLCLAVNRTVEYGIPVVVSAGNHGGPAQPNPEPNCPACAELAVAVGAKNPSGRVRPQSGDGDVFLKDKWKIQFPR